MKKLLRSKLNSMTLGESIYFINFKNLNLYRIIKLCDFRIYEQMGERMVYKGQFKSLISLKLRLEQLVDEKVILCP